MSLDPRPGSRTAGVGRTRLPRRRVPVVLIAFALLAVLVGACSKFDPSEPCTSDGTAPGAYPELEAMVPKLFRDAAPSQLDSGRTCSTDGLTTLKGHGIDELRYAGATWQTGTDSGLSLATFTSFGPTALRPEWVTEFYETGARNGKNVDTVDTSDYPVADGITGRKIDVLNNESYQSVIVWERDGRIEVTLVADFIREIQTKAAHEQVVRQAVDAWLAADGIAPPDAGSSVPDDLPLVTTAPSAAPSTAP
jgi:hypothetical protein